MFFLTMQAPLSSLMLLCDVPFFEPVFTLPWTLTVAALVRNIVTVYNITIYDKLINAYPRTMSCISSTQVRLHGFVHSIQHPAVFRNTPCCTLEIDGESQCFYQRMSQPLSMISVTCTPLTHYLPQSSGVWSHAATATESNNG